MKIENNAQLAIATKTNQPIVRADQEFQSAITNAATKYINLYARKYTTKDVCGMSEILPIVRNRIENLAVEGIKAGTIFTVADVEALIKSNAMMQPAEEKAIIEAFHNNVESAALYIYIFFSFKVNDFMKSSHLFSSENADDMYSALQTYLFTIVENFDFDRVAEGGLAKAYYRQAMCDFVRNELIGHNYSLFSLNRRQVCDLHKAQRITEEDSRKMSYDELAKKYNTSKVAVSLHFIMTNVVRLDATLTNDRDSSVSELVGDDSLCHNDVMFDNVENTFDFKNMFSVLDELEIEEQVAKSILSLLLNYADNSMAERGRIKKASKNVYKNIANEVNVPLTVVKTVVDSFSELFV